MRRFSARFVDLCARSWSALVAHPIPPFGREVPRSVATSGELLCKLHCSSELASFTAEFDGMWCWTAWAHRVKVCLRVPQGTLSRPQPAETVLKCSNARRHACYEAKVGS